MEDESSNFNPQRIKEFIKSNFLSLALGFLGLIFLGIGLIQLFQPKDDIQFEAGSESKEVKSESTNNSKILVDISGKVVSPGVYELEEGSRIKDALIAAGGLADDANRDFISKTINLAKVLSDGEKIYIPGQNEQAQTSSSSLISINSASASDLDKLPGIGVVTSEKIISNRPYGSIEELLTKNVVTKSMFEKIKDKITY